MSVWETLDSHTLWQSQWYNLRQDRVRSQDGHEFTYTLVDHPGAVWVVPVTRDGRIVLIRSYAAIPGAAHQDITNWWNRLRSMILRNADAAAARAEGATTEYRSLRFE